MLDRLLGRAELKGTIAELEDERDSLSARLEAEEERRSEAARKRQEAEERVNRLEDRITELADRVERATGDDDDGPSVAGHERLHGRRLTAVLDRLDSVDCGPEGALSAMVDDDVPDRIADAFGDRVGLVRRVAPALVFRDDAGLVRAALEPPLSPEPFAEWDEGFRLDRAWFRPTGRFAFGLIRSDTFVLGLYDGDDRVAVEGFTSDVTDEHDKGGFSQARFDRRRDEEIAAHLDRCRERLDALDAGTFGSQEATRRDDADPPAWYDGGDDLDRVILVGERTVLSEIDDYADHAASSDASGADHDALDDAFRDFWTTSLTLL
jgi:peptide subunit release factor 1 (eRF1)